MLSGLMQTDMQVDEDQKQLIDHILSSSFPWFYQPSTSDRFPFLGHVLMFRAQDNLPVSGVLNSPYYEHLKPIFDRFCELNNIKVNVVLRASLNLVVHDPAEENDIHDDHEFPYNVFLMYLNTFSKGETLLYDRDNVRTYTITPKQFRAVAFPGMPHSNRFCDPGERRVVLVITFL